MEELRVIFMGDQCNSPSPMIWGLDLPELRWSVTGRTRETGELASNNRL